MKNPVRYYLKKYRLLLNNDKEEDVPKSIYKEADFVIDSIDSIKSSKDNEFVFYVDPSLLYDDLSLQISSYDSNSDIIKIRNKEYHAPTDIENYIIAHQTMEKGYLIEKYKDDKTVHPPGKTALSHINNLKKKNVEFFSCQAFNPGGYETIKPVLINDSNVSVEYGTGDLGGFEKQYVQYNLDDMSVIKKYVFTPEFAKITEKGKKYELKTICDNDGNAKDIRLNGKSLDFVPLPLENFDKSSFGNSLDLSPSEDNKNIEIFVYGKDKNGTIIKELWLLSIESLPEVKLTESDRNLD